MSMKTELGKSKKTDETTSGDGDVTFGGFSSRYAYEEYCRRQNNKKTVRNTVVITAAVLFAVCLLSAAVLLPRVFGAGRAGTAEESVEGLSPDSGGDKNAENLIQTKTYEIIGAEAASSSVTVISGDGGEQVRTGGIIVTHDGYIVTCGHGSIYASDLRVQTDGGDTYSAELIISDAKSGLIVIKIHATGLEAAPFGSDREISDGDGIVLTGMNNSSAGTLHLSEGAVTVTSDAQWLAAGCALYNMNGAVVGMTTSGGQGASAVSSSVLLNVIKSAVSTGVTCDNSVSVELLGIIAESISDSDAEVYDLPHGAMVVRISNPSPAGAAGVEINDIIVSVGGTPITSAQQLKELRVSGETRIDVYRGDRYISFSAALG